MVSDKNIKFEDALIEGTSLLTLYLGCRCKVYENFNLKEMC